MANQRPTLEDLSQRCRLLNGLYLGTVWKHVASGAFYEITKISIRENDYEEIVVYSPVHHPDISFNRPLREWKDTTDRGHRFVLAERKVTYA